jgi:hypothetical protein
MRQSTCGLTDSDRQIEAIERDVAGVAPSARAWTPACTHLSRLVHSRAGTSHRDGAVVGDATARSPA